MKLLLFAFIHVSLFDKRWRIKTMKPETFSLGYKKNDRSVNAFSKLENSF